MNTTQTATEAKLRLAPYIFFYGRCEEALEFYKSALGGSYELMRVKDTPMKDEFPSDFRDKVMHASFTGGGVTFMAADGREAKTVNPDEGNICLALSASDAAEADRVFAALSQGGKVGMPLSDAFWGGRFGMLVDRFGTEWMITAP